MTPYPTDFPLEEIKNVAAIVQSGEIKADVVAHDSWVIIGYGMNFALGPGNPLVVGSLPPGREDDNGVVLLRDMIVDNPEVRQAIPPIVWKKAIKYLLDLVSGLL